MNHKSKKEMPQEMTDVELELCVGGAEAEAAAGEAIGTALVCALTFGLACPGSAKV